METYGIGGIGKREQFLKKLVNDSVTLKLADRHAITGNMKKDSHHDEMSKRTLEDPLNPNGGALVNQDEGRLIEAESE